MVSKSTKKIIPVILAGGSGSRLWPLSRRSFPKQFLNLLDDDHNHTMLQETYKRIENFENICKPIIICNEEHRFIVAHQMKQINIKPLDILLEPEGRNTTAAITIAALKVLEEFKNQSVDPILLILSSDHQIEDIKKFHLAIKNSIDIVLKNNLVIFGVPPTYPATGYGYIKSEDQLKNDQFIASKVDNFIEKPDLKTAKSLLKDKKYSWNSGMFIFKVSSIINEIKNLAPATLENCEECLKKSKKDLDFLRLEKDSFINCEDIPIDISVFEKTKKAFVIPLNCGWNDLGSWESLWKMSKKDADGNYINGRSLTKNTKDSFIKSEDKLVVSIGLRDIIVVETRDAVLIANKDSSHEVKEVVSLMKEKGFSEGQKFIGHGGLFCLLKKVKRGKLKKLRLIREHLYRFRCTFIGLNIG